ncbi:Mpr protein [Mycolicibacterium phlei]|jgi:hypothetical protein|nr:DUF4352 domain-containing protein [Mycolicibacterium phlei]AMO59890.1 Telomeric repeat-binding factor 2 [Mycolicibacterium phlei]KXW79096.1 hypothetical protein JL15_02240 [Mycolicibacterium phlei DSM 43071]STZ16460.1 Mpr protein [Mycolicibacterium phlei]VEG08016.1 Mpr protein [Mycobacteroides chelonae]
MTTQTPPGWYPDPSGSGRQMYWDGQGWAAPQAPTAVKKGPAKGAAWVAVAVVLLILLGIGKCGSSDESSSSSPTSTSSRTAAAAATPTVAPPGSAVRDGKFEFRVLGMERAAQAGDPSNPYMIAKPQGEFIILTLSVRNIGDRPQSYFGSNQTLIDTAGREYGADTEADMWMNDDGIMADINPGNAIQVRVAFDVPPGTQPAELEVHDSMFSGGAKVRLQ